MIALALTVAAILFVGYCALILSSCVLCAIKERFEAGRTIDAPIRSEETPKRVVLVHFPKDEATPDTQEERKSREFLAREAERVKAERESNRGAKPPFNQVPSTLVH